MSPVPSPREPSRERLATLLPAMAAWRQLRRFTATPESLAPAIRQTLPGAHAQPVLLAAILFLFAEHS